MDKCESCESESEHILSCSSCGKKLCPSCAHHFQDSYLCDDCLKSVYTHPVRAEPEKPPDKPAGQAGFAGRKPTSPQNLNLPIFQIASLIIVLAFLALGWTYITSMPPANATENGTIGDTLTEEEPEELPELTIPKNDSLNIYPHMKSYLEISSYNLICEDGTVTEINMSIKTGPLQLSLSSVELFEKEVLSDFSKKSFKANTISTTRFRNLQSYEQINQYNTTTLELIFVANRGIYQKAVLTPNPRNCPE